VVSPVVRFLSRLFVFFAGDKLQVIDFGILAPVDKLDNIGTDGAGRYLSHVGGRWQGWRSPAWTTSFLTREKAARGGLSLDLDGAEKFLSPYF
jgi:hypothetical protein